MKQIRIPRLALLLRVIWRNMIVFLHNLPIYVMILIWFDLPLGWHLLLIIPGFILISLNLTWMGLVIAILCARYRDIAPIVGSILQIGFFITPVMWNHKTQRVDPWVVEINPFAALIELIRAPMMGDEVSSGLLRLAILCLVFGSILAGWLFVRYRRQIVYWV
jgi:lipopolysaccharide transport system permease protein